MILSRDSLSLMCMIGLGKFAVPVADKGVAFAGHKKPQNSQKNGSRFGFETTPKYFFAIFLCLLCLFVASNNGG